MTSKYLIRIFYYFLTFFSVFGIISTASAGIAKIGGADCNAWGIRCTGNDTGLGVASYLWGGINVVLGFLAIVAAGALVYNGIMYIMSRGEEDKLRQAKTGIVFAILGMFVVGTAAWLVNSIINL